MQRSWFLDVMVSKRRSKAKTVSCVSWDVGGLPHPMLTFGIRKCGSPYVMNPAAARSYLLATSKRTDLVLAGRTQAQVNETIAAAIAKKELPAMEPGAMCYMMSKQGYGGDSAPHWPPHLMFFFPDTDPAIWGANLPGSPVLGLNDDHEHLTHVRGSRATVVGRNRRSLSRTVQKARPRRLLDERSRA